MDSPQPRRWQSIILWFTVALACCLWTAHAVAQEKAAPPAPEPAPAGNCCATAHTLDSLVHLSRAELEALYCQAPPAPMLNGYYRGKSIRWAGTCLTVLDSKITGCLWKGKHFNSCCGTLVNQWCGHVKRVHARVFCGESWLDGKPALIMDYRGVSPLVWRHGRDELREICPGLYLGVMYKDKCPHPKFVRFFALECASACAGK